ncbi:sugar ABC transporter substrate-binding protein [Serinicoccus sp. CNJ-927]|nr:sugar ABC transporter substrate-binding protein [Serinicoccus sp. CNJ-927]
MVATTRWRRATVPAVTAAAALTLTGCLQNPEAATGGGFGGVGAEPEEGDGVVSILGAFGGDEEEQFNASLAEFEEESGIDVQYVSDQDFTNTIQVRADAGDLPDIGLFPQPGGVLSLAERGALVPIDSMLDYDEIESTLVNGFLDSARYDGRVYAAPMRMAVKSIVWYPKQAFEENGWDAEPATLEELDELAAQIQENTDTPPWCIGWQSDQATGWVGTDWVEEYMLRLHGPDVYDDWIYHRIPFNDERVVEAVQAYGELATDDDVLGGSRGILNTPFADAMTPAFDEDPGCYLMRQGNFATGFFPEDVQENLDEEVGIFTFPPAADGYDGQPILGGGDLAAAFTYDTDTAAVMEFLASDQFGGPWAQAGGWLSPHTSFDASLYPDDTTRQIAEMGYTSDVFRYDGSDVMPREVGSGSFWTGMVDFQSGSASAQEMADEIENGWPQSDEPMDEEGEDQ